MTPDETHTALLRAGRNKGPALLAEWWIEGDITTETLAARVGDVWSSAEYPDTYLDHETWRMLFAAAGFTVDGQPAARPTRPITLYRGSVPERRGDWSWTDRIEIARCYADGQHYRRPKSTVWTALVEPWRLLARNTYRDESEYVVDTEGLTISAA